MTGKIQKPQPILTIDIKPGPATPKQRAAWQKLWQKPLSEPKSEVAK